MSEESLSNDDYECVSPDDISLPPLSATPESNLVWSDRDEAACCSSHSAQNNHYYSEHNQYSSHSAQNNQYSSHSAQNNQDINQYHMETGVVTGLVLDRKHCPTDDTDLQYRARSVNLHLGSRTQDMMRHKDKGNIGNMRTKET